MRKFLVTLPLILLLGGCAVTSGLFGHTSQKVSKQNDKITVIDNKINDNKDKKIVQVQQFSFGTGYALNKVTNKEPAITVAKEMNNRVETIVGLPELQQQTEIIKMVGDLISNNIVGQQELASKDKDINLIQKEEVILIKQKDLEIQKALDLSKSIALQNDASQAQLSKYQGWFGLSAVFIGLKDFIKHASWILLGGSIIFLILRILSTTNPIASAIFSLVDTFFSWVINCIKYIAPKAMSIAGTVSVDVYNNAKNALTSIVDSVETVKLQADASGQPATLEDLLNTAELSMTPQDKILVEQIKIKLGWTKVTPVSTVAPISPVTLSAPITPVTQVPANTQVVMANEILTKKTS